MDRASLPPLYGKMINQFINQLINIDVKTEKWKASIWIERWILFTHDRVKQYKFKWRYFFFLSLILTHVCMGTVISDYDISFLTYIIIAEIITISLLIRNLSIQFASMNGFNAQHDVIAYKLLSYMKRSTFIYINTRP